MSILSMAGNMPHARRVDFRLIARERFQESLHAFRSIANPELIGKAVDEEDNEEDLEMFCL